MSLIPDEIIEQVKDATDIVSLVQESVELKRTGSDWRGPCPFHGGTHRNFAVIPRKGLFYCYVCHEAGDVFSYMIKRFGMDYPTAVRELARRAGIVVPERQQRSGPDPNEPLYGAVAAAQDERDEMQLYLAHAASLAGSLRLARYGRPWPLPIELVEAELWLEVDRFAEARDAFARVGEASLAERVALGTGSVMERLDDGPAACTAYRRAAAGGLAPAAVERARLGLARLDCPHR